MTGLSRPAVRRILWAAAALLLPLPYLTLAQGAVPVVRYALLAGIVGAYGVGMRGDGVAWLIFAMLLAHALLYAALLAVAARLAARLLPDPTPARAVAAGLVLVFGIALALPIYHTPFDDQHAHTTWTGLFQ